MQELIRLNFLDNTIITKVRLSDGQVVTKISQDIVKPTQDPTKNLLQKTEVVLDSNQVNVLHKALVLLDKFDKTSFNGSKTKSYQAPSTALSKTRSTDNDNDNPQKSGKNFQMTYKSTFAKLNTLSLKLDFTKKLINSY